MMRFVVDRVGTEVSVAGLRASRPLPGSSDISVFRCRAGPDCRKWAGQSIIEIARLPPRGHLVKSGF
jgi:hypothetical protein